MSTTPGQFLDWRSPQCVPDQPVSTAARYLQGTKGRPENRVGEAHPGRARITPLQAAVQLPSLLTSGPFSWLTLSPTLTSAPGTCSSLPSGTDLHGMPRATCHLAPAGRVPRPPTNIMSTAGHQQTLPHPLLFPVSHPQALPSLLLPVTCGLRLTRGLYICAAELCFSEWFRYEQGPGIVKYENAKVSVITPHCRSIYLLLRHGFLLPLQLSFWATIPRRPAVLTSFPLSTKPWARLPELWSDSLELALLIVIPPC